MFERPMAMASTDVGHSALLRKADRHLERRADRKRIGLTETLRAPFEQLDIEVEHVLERGDRILVLFQFRAEGRQGLVLNARSGHVGQMRDGLLTRIDAFPDWQTAAAVVGMTLDEI